MLQMCKKFYDNESIYKLIQLNLARTKMEEEIFEKKVYKVLLLF